MAARSSQEAQTTTKTVQLRLLGGFGLSHDGLQIETTPAAQRLLAFIALTPRGADRTYVACQLWPEHTEHRAKANLRSAIWRLGKAPKPLLAATKSRLCLADGVWVDVRNGLEELASTGMDSILDTALPFDALDSDLLPDWYDDWLTIERERLRQFRLGALEEAAARATERGRYGQAIQFALAAVAADPLRESSHRLVIEAHLAKGNRVDAQRQYNTCRDILIVQTGYEPNPALTALIDAEIDLAGGPVLAAA